MAFCTACGTSVPETTKFCTGCGAPMNAAQEAAPQPTPAESVVTAQVSVAPAAVDTPPVQTTSPLAVAPPLPVSLPASAYDAPISTGAFVGLIILFGLPVIGFIACIVMAFAVKNKNIRNYARATLILILVSFVLMIVLALVAWLLWGTLQGVFENLVGSFEFGFLE